MTFSKALERLRLGNTVKRVKWSGSISWESNEKGIEYIYWDDDKLQYWDPSLRDILSDDWVIVGDI